MYIQPKKSLGQNFLIDKNIQNKLVECCCLDRTQTVLEIGPGRGEITQLMVDKVKRLFIVEIDKRLCDALREKFSSRDNLEIINCDILKIDLSKYHDLTIIGNLPYYISTPIISHLIRYKASINKMFFTLQKELGQRLLATCGSKDYGSFSCFVQFHTKLKLLFTIKNSSFWPKPKVDSCFLELQMLKKPPYYVTNEDYFFQFLRTAFNPRRKLLKNNLNKLYSQNKIVSIFKKSKLRTNVRAENLSLKDFVSLYNKLMEPF